MTQTSSWIPFTSLSSAGVFLAHEAGLAVAFGSAEQRDSTPLPWQVKDVGYISPLGPCGGKARFIQTKALKQAPTLQTISSQSLWITFLSSFSITLWTDKKPFREILSRCCHFNPTDVKVIFTLFLLS